jgi:hypothetical protein
MLTPASVATSSRRRHRLGRGRGEHVLHGQPGVLDRAQAVPHESVVDGQPGSAHRVLIAIGRVVDPHGAVVREHVRAPGHHLRPDH